MMCWLVRLVTHLKRNDTVMHSIGEIMNRRKRNEETCPSVAVCTVNPRVQWTHHFKLSCDTDVFNMYV
jgi:hypothetical protein